MASIAFVISHFSITPIALILFYMVLEQYPELAHAFPCIGDDAKEYCTGYRAGAIQAKADYKTGHDLDIDQRTCSNNTKYCSGYTRGYNDEADFLG
ncbi:MAG TPA: hypothetical protein VJ729_05945 [Nitrososphaeraceae archaeon]|nr:hypothetical protein [Nitrososphaeraceae archaeon]